MKAEDFQALKQALALSEAQIAQIQQTPSFPSPGPGGGVRLYDRNTRLAVTNSQTRKADLLDDSQRAKLAEIKKTLDRPSSAEAAIGLGLIAANQWPGWLCPSDPFRSYADTPFSRGLALSETQLRELEEIRQKGPRPDLAQATLNPVQRAKLAEFERDLQLASEAVELGLLLRADREVLCH